MRHEKYYSCTKACEECAIECKKCASSDLLDQHTKMLTQCIKLNEDCASFCVVAIAAMAGKHEFADKILNLCAEICEACALECERHAHIEHCANCAEACRKCAEECRAASKIKSQELQD